MIELPSGAAPYTAHRLHWYPDELIRCARLADGTVSTQVLYGNCKFRPHFPPLRPQTTSAAAEAGRGGACKRG